MPKPKQLPPVEVDFEGEATLSEAIEKTGNRLGELRSLRQILAGHLDSPNTLARDISALARQYRDVSKDIEELEAQQAAYDAELTLIGGEDSGEDVAFDASAI